MRSSLLLAVSLAGCFTPPELDLIDEIPFVGTNACAPGREARVYQVLDGDTVDIDGLGDAGERIRFLGIDAPEIAHEGNPADCWGNEAGDHLRQLADGRQVTVTFDEECVDVYGRTLAYVWISTDDANLDPEDVVQSDDGSVLLNELMLARGQARLFDEDWVAPLRLQDRLDAAQAEAKARGLGLWSACGSE
jgi:micrococcal nuclease